MKDLLNKIEELAKVIFAFEYDYDNKTIKRVNDGFAVRYSALMPENSIEVRQACYKLKIEFKIVETLDNDLRLFISQLQNFIEDYKGHEAHIKEAKKAELRKQLEELEK